MKAPNAAEMKDLAKQIKASTPKASFKNEHGEKFTIYSDGRIVLMSGDEVNAMVDSKYAPNGLLPLFNEHFSIWSNDELLLLGKALVRVSLTNKRQTASAK